MSLGSLLRAFRERRLLTQEQVAERARVSVRTVRRLETDDGARARGDSVNRLADALELDAADREALIAAVRTAAPSEAAEASEAHQRPRVGSSEAPAQLPLAGFTGRRDALNRLDTLLDEADGRAGGAVIVAVSGTAGVGKTALAVHWGHRVAHRFPDGQLYVNLRGFDPTGQVTHPSDALRGLLDALGVPAQRLPADLDAQAALYRSLLAGRRVLVVLDNVRDTEQVQPLLPASTTTVTVVTSRNQLTSLVAAGGARPLPLDLLSASEARDLLAHRLGADAVAAEPDAVQQIIDACSRLPLALSVAAARAQQTGFPLAAIACELHQDGHRLGALDLGEPTSQVSAVFSWSYQALSQPSAQLFRQLGLHPGPDLDTAAAASLAGRTLPDTRRLLAELTRATLLTEHAPGRYSFHDLLRAYAVERVRAVDPVPEHEAALTRLLDHYVHTSNTALRLANPQAPQPVLPLTAPAPGTYLPDLADLRQAAAWVRAEYAVLFAAIRLAAGLGFNAHAWHLARSFTTFRNRDGYLHDHLAVWGIALPATELLADTTALAWAYQRIGLTQTYLGHNAEAHHHLRHALDLFVGAGNVGMQSMMHYLLSVLATRENDAERGLHHAQACCRLAVDVGDRRGEAFGLVAVSGFLSMLGDHPRAMAVGRRGLAQFDDINEPIGQANALDNLGSVLQRAGHPAMAVDLHRRAVTLFHGLEVPVEEAASLGRLGDACLAAGDRAAARVAWQAALDLMPERNHAEAADLRGKLSQ